MEIKIIKSASHANAKFEVFQRLNHAPTTLSGQEYRNALLVMLNKQVFTWLQELSANIHYQECIDLTERWIDERYDNELVLRMFIFSQYATNNSSKVDDYLNENLIYDEKYILNRVQNGNFNLDLEKANLLKSLTYYTRLKESKCLKKEVQERNFWNHISKLLQSDFTHT